MTTDMRYGRTVLHLDLDDIEAAGFKTDGMTEQKFNRIWNNLTRYYDANWLGMVAEACEGAGIEQEGK